MDKADAEVIVNDRLANLRQRTRAELETYLDSPVTDEITSASGVVYQAETQALWDDRDRRNLRVMVSVDDGGWRSLAPVSDDFIIGPDGAFVGD